MVFCAFNSSQEELSVVCQQIFGFSIFYSFRANRDQSSGGRGNSISYNMENLFLNSISMDFFSPKYSLWKIKKVTPVLRIIWVKMIFYPIISLCPAFYCVQHFTVSSTLLCPHLPKGSFVYHSHFNMLWLYHAALAKHLCSELFPLDVGYTLKVCFRYDTYM